ncbi:alpha/beta fold hydrolase [Maritimibacter sp. DP1N21-5]|uniref:alpha/beta fold hydrolase n=1 Tax=Maritimibacter sp. DP1N21-5 TaxID=2836867 RepID=UPI001C45EC82|nr:alpha/beta hydrolase [Maritimibacter sp. DP1N21-5]MBV7407987.1 alpha/beta hydrolase [Maritimibacter sp. DP1N21-5]
MSRSRFLPLLGHELHVTEWGDPGAPPVICWHGLARTGRDFDELAARLADTHFVLCPDTIGRGMSSWSEAPEDDYRLPHYADIARAMMDLYGMRQVRWIGTSMGGQIGMTVASQTPDRIASLVINDIGPEVPTPAMDRIVTYSSELPTFDTVNEAERWLREVYVPFGPADDSFWSRMAETSVRRRDDGKLTIHYDPRLIAVLESNRGMMDLWPAWEEITAPTLVIRGADSDLLTEGIAARMSATGPAPRVLVMEGYGHAPNLSTGADWDGLAPVLRDYGFLT